MESNIRQPITNGATYLELVDHHKFDYNDGYQGTRVITATSKDDGINRDWLVLKAE